MASRAGDGSPVVGANVVLAGTKMGAATDINGVYYTTNIPAGTYEVQVSAAGYKTVHLPDLRISADLLKVQNVTLEETALQGEEVTIFAERPLIELDKTSSVQITDAAQLQQLPVRGYNYIIKIQSGVQSYNYNSTNAGSYYNENTNGPRISVRGSREDEVMFNVDGVTLNDPYSGFITFRIPDLAWDEFAFRKGNFSAEYGRFMSGVVCRRRLAGKPYFAPMNMPNSTLEPAAWLTAAGIPHHLPRAWRMPGGGSDRVMTRIWPDGGKRKSLVLVENPHPQTFGGPLNENHSFWYVGGLLRKAGGHGPALVFADLEQGWYLVEDLGDTLLLALVEEAGREDPRVEAWMEEVLDILLDLQHGLQGVFDPTRVHALPYDYELMTVWESGYFRERFAEGLLGLPLDRAAFDSECQELARRVETSTPKGVLFRDFQSTNVLRTDDSWRLIDFQGARLGPPQYDVASFVNDPYLRLPAPLRSRLVQRFARRRAAHGLESAASFLEAYPLVAAHRMMQALGAYGLLSKVKGKWWFLRHVPAALGHLQELLGQPAFDACPELRRVTRAAAEQVAGGVLERLRPADEGTA